ncbi:MAG TPA: hypothetical protein VGF99_00965 [Myxococcota bacterium]
MSRRDDDPRVDRLLRGSNRVMFVGAHRTYLATTLAQLAEAWPQMPGGPPPMQPTATIDDLVALDARNAAAVDVVLQSIALMALVPMLVMQLLVGRDGRVVDLDFAWQRGRPVRLRVVVEGVDGVARRFESDRAEDHVVLQQVVLSPLRADDDDDNTGAALFGGFRPLVMPFG